MKENERDNKRLSDKAACTLSAKVQFTGRIIHFLSLKWKNAALDNELTWLYSNKDVPGASPERQ